MAFDTLTRLGASGASTGYEIERSVRFVTADSTALKRTPDNDGDRQQWTTSFWFKKWDDNITGADNDALFAAKISGSNNDVISIGNDEVIHFKQEISNTGKTIEGTTKLRDSTGWYHLVIAHDTTQATAANRVKVWINGKQETMSGSFPNQNSNGNFNRDIPHYIGATKSSSNANPLSEIDAYIADFHFIDGTVLDYTSFAETNSETGVYTPINYTGSYGTNGFHLNFSDNSDVTASTLGADSSGNGNNFTPVNLSVSSGVGCDSVTDTPTNNFCTLNSLENGYGTTTYKQGNLEMAASNAWVPTRGTMAVTSGKWYWEVYGADGNTFIGVAPANTDISTINPMLRDGVIVYYGSDGKKRIDGTFTSYGSAYGTSNVIGVALDIDNGKLYFAEDNTWQDSGDPTSGATGTGAINLSDATGLVGSQIIPFFVKNGTQFQVNFGQQPFTHTPPSGYKTLCTNNLPEPAITKPQNYFKPKIYTGTVTGGATQSITGIGFQPDLTWIKRRDDGNSSHIVDSARGAGKCIESNSTNAEDASNPNGLLTAFNSDGFTLTGGSTNGVLCCEETATYVAWNWKEDASTAGFDIVLDTGTGSAHTVAHGLGAKPELILRKGRTQTDNWSVYSPYLNANDATEYLKLNEGDTQANYDGIWNDTPPTSSVFTVGSDGQVNEDDVTYVTYLFKTVPGFSKIGSYKGNDSTDGPFVYCGFQPAFVMTKRMDGSAGSWLMYDNVRTTTNPMHINLYADLPDEEFTNTGSDPQMDFCATGFKVRSSYHSMNHSTGPHLFVAFAHTALEHNSTAL